MAFDQTLQGTIGNDNIFQAGLGNISFLYQTLQGDDKVIFDSDIKLSEISLDGGNDDLLVTSTSTVNPSFLNSTLNGGGGADKIRLRTRTGRDNFIFGGLGDDTIQLSAVTGNNASYVRTSIFGDTGAGAPGGVDTVYIDNSVAVFNQSLVNLEDNENGLIAPVVDNAIDLVTGFLKDSTKNTFELLTSGLEGMLVQAGEVFQSTFRGGGGSDWIVFDSLLNPFAGAAGTTPLDTSLVSGNEGDDAVAILRSTSDSTINGGRGDDYLVAFSGINRFSLFNGNRGADLIVVGQLESQNSSFFGGQGDDVLEVGALEATNSSFEGNLGNDRINFFALQSTNSTLSGGEGDDIIDDYSTAIRTLGNVLDGGTGDDVIRQAANILLSGVADFGSTIVGGQGADVMTGDSNFQTVDPKEFDGVDNIDGASKDLFRFSFGDSVINAQGVGHDEITDFDSNASFYIGAAGDPEDPNDYVFRPGAGPVDPLSSLQRDVIDLTDTNIKVGVSKTIDIGGGATVNVNVNNRGLSNANNITDFIQAGVLQDRGAAILFNQFPDPFAFGAPFDTNQFRASWLFISDGDQELSEGDLLIELRNVAFDPDNANAGMIINGGNITNFVF